MDATYRAAQDLIYALQNPELASPLVKLGHEHKESLKTLADIYRKSNPPAVPPRVPVTEVGQKKIQEVNQEGTHMKRAPQSNPITNTEPEMANVILEYITSSSRYSNRSVAQLAWCNC